MAETLVKNLLEAGVHFGHKASSWNPKMQPYIFTKKNGIHIIDVRQTIRGLLLAKRLLSKLVADGKDILFVGTKRQARPAIEAQVKDVAMPYVVERWLGGTLTNFRTIRSRLKRLEELEALMSSEEWEHYSKKMASQLTRERQKIDRNLGGIRTMNKLPGAVVVVDVRREINALRESQKLGIPTICIIDTDSNPDMADLPIPGNDDAMRAIELIIKELCAAITEGKTAQAQQDLAAKSDEQDSAEPTRRRSRRAMFRAEKEADEDEDAAASPKPSSPVTSSLSTPVQEGPAEPVAIPHSTDESASADSDVASESPATPSPSQTPSTDEAEPEKPADH